MMAYKKNIVSLLLLCFLITTSFPDQEKKTAEKEITLGITYEHFFHLSENVNNNFTFFDISGEMTFPFTGFQPLLSAGVFFCNEDADSEYAWTHNNLYAKGGMQYVHHFTHHFQAGASITGGITWASLEFPAGYRNLYNLLADAELFFRIKPIPALSINVNPVLRYYHSLTLVERFEGFHFAIGGNVCYHINIEGPGKKHELRIHEIQTEPIFASLKNFYPENQVGVVIIDNSSNTSVKDIKISLAQADFMDLPTPALDIPELLPGERQQVRLFGVFNDNILSTSGIQSFTGEIIVSYQSGQHTKELTETTVFHLYDKNSLVWDDDRKIACFINPRDSIVRDFTGSVRSKVHPYELENFNKPLQMGILFYTAIASMGCFYQPDPKIAPLFFNDMKVIVDSVSYPGETLRQLSGDCDDLTVLFLTLLESVGVETGFITIPGHILPVFNTGLKTKEYRLLYPEKEMFISRENSIWIPVEMTCIGKKAFLDAWQKGVQKWDEAKDRRRIYTTKEAQHLYKPVVPYENSLDTSWDIDQKLAEEFVCYINELAGLIIQDYVQDAEITGSKQDYTNLGMMYACFNDYASAEGAFLQALAIDSAYVYAKYNLGSIYFLRKMYSDAFHIYNQLLSFISKDNKLYKNVLIQLSNTCFKLNDYKSASAYYQMLSALPGGPGDDFRIATLEQGSSDYDYSFYFYFITEKEEQIHDTQ